FGPVMVLSEVLKKLLCILLVAKCLLRSLKHQPARVPAALLSSLLCLGTKAKVPGLGRKRDERLPGNTVESQPVNMEHFGIRKGHHRARFSSSLCLIDGICHVLPEADSLVAIRLVEV